MPTVIMMGNPGSGKSTLLSSLVGDTKFSSGPSIGKGMTIDVKEEKYNNSSYVDTPGLSDVILREQAAGVIIKALRMGGKFKVVFVVTLESGRVKPDDVATIKLVLDAIAPTEPNQYSIIVNKISNTLITLLKESEKERDELACYLIPPSTSYGTRSIFYVPMDPDLFDQTDKLLPLSPELLSFISNAPEIDISPKRVQEIQYTQFEQIVNELREQIRLLQEDNERMRKAIADRDEEFRKFELLSPPVKKIDDQEPPSASSSPRGPLSAIFISDCGVWECALLTNLVENRAQFHPVDADSKNKLKLQAEEHKGTTYINAPGLANEKTRTGAGKAIKHTLQNSGNFAVLQWFLVVNLTNKVFFIVSVAPENSMIRPEDLATLALVVQAVPKIKDCHSVIIKMSREAGDEATRKELEDKYKFARSIYVDPDTPKHKILSPDLHKFVVEAPAVSITKKEVQPMNYKAFKDTVKQMQQDNKTTPETMTKFIDRILHHLRFMMKIVFTRK